MSELVVSRLAAKNWPFSLEYLPQPVYMVGGAVRDAILGRVREYVDLDFIIPVDAVKVARKIAQRYQAGFVLLDAERQIARAVFPEATADFAQQDGESLITDLYRRDFTINAIAYNPHTQEIIDPLEGYKDLESGLLRMISPVNLQNDPLRLMRAYRQAAQLGFTIESTTQETIRSLAQDIRKVAAERVRVEVGYLLATSHGTFWLNTAWQDGVLTSLFKNATDESFIKLSAVDEAYALIKHRWQELGEELTDYVRETVKTSWLSIAKLACLVDSKPEIAELELQELTYSRAEIRGVTTGLRLFAEIKTVNMPLRKQYFLFREMGILFPAVLVLALANDIVAKGRFEESMLVTYEPLIKRYLDKNDVVAHPIPLLNGKDMMTALNIPASPLIGELLMEVGVAQAEGKISTVEAAIEFAANLVKT
ncbi:CCA tRNA nucleotidyltransferase [Dolichospermum sp. ST_sed1]|nr:CCA tRNA nucleotidyltransferase [Dolichospermum sp. ST_sed1]MDD1423698.1 CCA tRNA nucleotidyltransferase [Dolichospermum sp. ST_sed9]MDD1432679.1 CCA tRNA nucleotidyltransferase [Dolichospermum sp. ST_sed6]MDD1435798.1 CCA tRNA nucleotidyltransferase [Dolichospermum sp. ST_sed10]MDD1441963.1 CCA tRNA nucleotidyltransferase [Dolichospermum sp. ST_sed3]MDD1447132.1 CCA tRNA nucleotidyltransferase [Dolichospermum sp. ST_sed8]MDD1455408.1 CCA tRNA nucleotidyltransferase [Dolichospermum sp. ST_